MWSGWDEQKTAAVQRPPWVRTVDKPTTEIDWEKMQPFDGTYALGAAMAMYVGDQRTKELAKKKPTIWQSGFGRTNPATRSGTWRSRMP